MAELGGTVTFLITDVEGSTRLWAEDADAMSKAMARHDELLRRVVADHGGELFKHTGDGICAAFPTATAAWDAARAAQAVLEVPVRMGLHTGAAERRDGDWFGSTLNRTARIADAGHGGQVLCSQATAALIGDEAVELGRYRLKGLDQPETILQLGGGSFPELRAGASTVRLPPPGTELFGRAALIAHVAELLGSERLVTLFGPGGVGKTRVAVEAARRRTGRVDRIAFVDLTTTDDPAGIVKAASGALDAQLQSTDALIDALRSADALLVLDNCEHVIDAVVDLVESLLVEAPRVAILATSREVFELGQERVVAVPPLDDEADLVGLFVRRASAAGAPLGRVDPAEVAELCRRLDGLPLAIELAAARSSVFSVPELLARLDDRLQLLSTGRRRSRDRHRTMLETIGWSYDLLDDRERKTYTRLASFVDWFDVGDAVAVTGGSDYETVEDLEALLAKSLLARGEHDGRRRYRFLESIRDHALDRLHHRGEHAAAMNAMATRIAERIRQATDAVVYDDRLEALEQVRELGLHHRHCATWAVSQHDQALGRALVEPYLELIPEVFHEPFEVGRGFVEAAGDGPVDDVFTAIDLYERVYRLERGVWRPTIEALDRHPGGLEGLSAHARTALWFAGGMIDDNRTHRRLHGVWAELGHPMSQTYHFEPDPGGVSDVAHLEEGLRRIDVLECRLVRAWQIYNVANRVQPVRRPDLWREALHRTELVLEWLPEWSDIHSQTLISRAGLQRALGDPLAAAHSAELSMRLGRHRGVYGNMIPPLVTLLVLAHDLDLPETGARLRGRVPRRWSLYFQPDRDAVTGWCDSILDEQTRARLASEGTEMDLLELVERSVDEIERATRRT